MTTRAAVRRDMVASHLYSLGISRSAAAFVCSALERVSRRQRRQILDALASGAMSLQIDLSIGIDWKMTASLCRQDGQQFLLASLPSAGVADVWA